MPENSTNSEDMMANPNANPDLAKALAILARDPRNFGAHVQVGVYYSQEKNWEKSAFHLKKALAADKKNPLILQKLSDVLIRARQPSQARKHARKLVELQKNSPEALHTMARAYEATGELKKAQHWIDLALVRDPNNELMLFDKASYYSTIGEMDKSLAVHSQILKLNPISPHSWWPVAQLQKYEGEKAKSSIRQVDAAIAAASSKEDLRGLHYAAGKINQDAGNHDAAFGHFEKANLLHDQPITADRIIAANINFRETYSEDFFASVKKMGTQSLNQSDRPIFILGQTRSGTTLTESLCAAHSKVSAGGELPHFSDYNKWLEVFSAFEKTHQGQVHSLDSGKIRGMASDFISKTKHLAAPGTRLTDKMPPNFLHIGLIATVFPNAQIIHCRRHPLDNCLSIFSNPMLDYHKEYKSRLEVLGEYFRNYVQIMEFWRQVSPIPIHDIYYEDLVTNTQSVARRMIDHLGLEWEDHVMERAGSQKAVKTLSVWQVRQPVFQTSKGKWRDYQKQLEPLREVLSTYVEDYERELAELDTAPILTGN
jgi:tetratricopeptide (TPR) repeat protein